jgi:hypothetical protein
VPGSFALGAFERFGYDLNPALADLDPDLIRMLGHVQEPSRMGGRFAIGLCLPTDVMREEARNCDLCGR